LIRRMTLTGSLLAAVLIALACLAVLAGSGLPAGQIAFESNRGGDWDIYIVDLRTLIVYNFTHNPANDQGVAWSPVTRQLAFFSTRGDQMNGMIYAQTLTSRRANAITSGDGNYWKPAWSPDGAQVVMVRDYGNIRVIDSSGANERELVYGFGPTWSPDGESIAFYADRPGDLNGDIYLIDADGRNYRSVTDHPANDWSPAWSPDSRTLAFVSSRDGNAEIYSIDVVCVANLDNCPAQRLTHHRATDAEPTWSADGGRIAFESQRDGNFHIYVMNPDGTRLRRITRGEDDNRSPVWLP
jgi:TolB protein